MKASEKDTVWDDGVQDEENVKQQEREVKDFARLVKKRFKNGKGACKMHLNRKNGVTFKRKGD